MKPHLLNLQNTYLYSSEVKKHKLLHTFFRTESQFKQTYLKTIVAFPLTFLRDFCKQILNAKHALREKKVKE